MSEESQPTSKAMLWTGRVLSFLPGAMLLLDGVMKIVKHPEVVKGMAQAGYPESCLVPLGLALTAGAILYFIPRTAAFGAIILTGYLGGAVATHVRLNDPAIQVLAPVIFATVLWAGLVLRDARVRTVLPFRR